GRFAVARRALLRTAHVACSPLWHAAWYSEPAEATFDQHCQSGGSGARRQDGAKTIGAPRCDVCADSALSHYASPCKAQVLSFFHAVASHPRWQMQRDTTGCNQLLLGR